MKTFFLQAFVVFLIAFTFNASAIVRYVDLNCPTPISPYTNWATAATNIQSAVNISHSPDIVFVTNGIYLSGGISGPSGSNRVAVLNPGVTVQSVNGPEVTFIKGYQVPGTTNNGANSVRCVYLNDSSSLSGFTLSNGAAVTGGGIFMGPSCVASNCIISDNTANSNFFRWRIASS